MSSCGLRATGTNLGGGCAALLSVPIPTLFVTFLDFPFSCYLVQLVEYSCWGCLSAATLPSSPALLLHNLCPSRDVINPINFELWPSLGKNTSLPSHWDSSTFPKYFSLQLHFLWGAGKFKTGKLGSQACVKQCHGVTFQGRGAWTFTLANLGLTWTWVLTFLWQSVKFSEHSVNSATAMLLFSLHWCIF